MLKHSFLLPSSFFFNCFELTVNLQAVQNNKQTNNSQPANRKTLVPALRCCNNMLVVDWWSTCIVIQIDLNEDKCILLFLISVLSWLCLQLCSDSWSYLKGKKTFACFSSIVLPGQLLSFTYVLPDKPTLSLWWT